MELPLATSSSATGVGVGFVSTFFGVAGVRAGSVRGRDTCLRLLLLRVCLRLS